VDENFQNLCLLKVNRKFSLEGERGGIEKLTKRSKVCSSSLIWNLVWGECDDFRLRERNLLELRG
jgi:hypothetical protein